MTERVRCYDCHRPKTHCVCGLIVEIDNRTEILILQHPRERSHAFNTARLVKLSLRRAEIVVDHGGKLASDETLPERLAGYGLLYPRPGAMDLAQVPEDERPKKLVVLDGTWYHARSMYRDIKALQDLPHYTLPAGQVSGFKIRKQPKDYCLSTLEAIQSALTCLEPEAPGLDTLTRSFDAMQTQHLAASAEPTPRRKRFKQKPPHKYLPAALTRSFDSLIVVYAEMSPVAIKGQPRQLLTFAAERPSTGECMHCVLKDAFQGADQWSFLRLSESDIEQGCTLAELQTTWDAFRRPGDVMAAWSPNTVEVINAHLQDELPTVAIRRIYFDHRPSRGCLEQIVVQEDLLSQSASDLHQSEMTRTEERLWNVAAVARLLHDIPTEALVADVH